MYFDETISSILRVILDTFWTLPMICTTSGLYLDTHTQFTANSIPNSLSFSSGTFASQFDFGTEKKWKREEKNEAQTFRQSSRIRIMEFDQKRGRARA